MSADESIRGIQAALDKLKMAGAAYILQQHEVMVSLVEASRPALASLPALDFCSKDGDVAFREQLGLLFSAAACSAELLQTVADALGLSDPDALGPGWLNVRFSNGKTLLHATAKWGCVSSFTFLFDDLRARAFDWQCLLAAHETAFPSVKPLLLQACRAYHLCGYVHANYQCADQNNANWISTRLAAELSVDALTQVWCKFTCVVYAAENGNIPLLRMVKSRLDPMAWAALVGGDRGHGHGRGHRCDEESNDMSEHVGYGVLSRAASTAQKQTVAWLLENAVWSTLDVACATQAAVRYGRPICPQNAYAILLQLVGVLVNRWREGMVEDGHQRMIVLRLLSNVLAHVLECYNAREVVTTELLRSLLQDLGVEMTFTGPTSVFRFAAQRSADGLRYVFAHMKAIGADFCIATSPIDDLGTTLLMAVAKSSTRDTVRAVVDEICSLDVDMQVQAARAVNSEGRTAGQLAASKWCLETLELFETRFPAGSFGADTYSWLKGAMNDDSSALAKAVHGNLPALVAGLLRAGAHPLVEFHGTVNSEYWWSCESALEVSMDMGETHMFELVLAAVPAQVDSTELQRILHKCLLRACDRGANKLVCAVLETMVSRGYPWSMSALVECPDHWREGWVEDEDEDKEGMSPLQVAVLNKHESCIDTLFQFVSFGCRWSEMRRTWIGAVVCTVLSQKSQK